MLSCGEMVRWCDYLRFKRYITRIINAITPSGPKMNLKKPAMMAPTKLKINPKIENMIITARIIKSIVDNFTTFSSFASFFVDYLILLIVLNRVSFY